MLLFVIPGQVGRQVGTPATVVLEFVEIYE